MGVRDLGDRFVLVGWIPLRVSGGPAHADSACERGNPGRRGSSAGRGNMNDEQHGAAEDRRSPRETSAPPRQYVGLLTQVMTNTLDEDYQTLAARRSQAGGS